MPIVRYVLFAGAFVVALLFALDRSLPPLAEMSAGPDVDRSVIRIHSARAWPEKIIFDTSSRIATTASSPLLASERQEDHANGALTMAPQKPETRITSASQPSAVAATNVRAKRTPPAASSRRLSEHQVMVGTF